MQELFIDSSKLGNFAWDSRATFSSQHGDPHSDGTRFKSRICGMVPDTGRPLADFLPLILSVQTRGTEENALEIIQPSINRRGSRGFYEIDNHPSARRIMTSSLESSRVTFEDDSSPRYSTARRERENKEGIRRDSFKFPTEKKTATREDRGVSIVLRLFAGCFSALIPMVRSKHSMRQPK